jgi:ATP-dependent Lon protease
LKRVILPKGNQKDLRDLPEEVRNEMHFTFAERVSDVLTEMLPALKPPVRREVNEFVMAD